MSKYYSKNEKIARVLWSATELIFFRPSPRLMYGWRNFILRLFGAHIGSQVKIFPTAKITFPWLLRVEDKVIISWNVTIYNLGEIRIGSRTVVSQNSHLCGGTHDYLAADFTLKRTGLTVGNNVWIAADAFIGPGIKIGDNAVIGARAVVKKDVQAETMVDGNPATLIRQVKRPNRI